MKKNAMVQPQWLKLGFQNYDYFKARKQICYSGKKVFFSWKYSIFQDVLLTFKWCFNDK